MRFWSSRAIGIVGGIAVCGCSAGPSKEPEQPRTDVTPIPTVKASAPPPRPSPCEVAGLLVTRAEALRGDGLLERAKRALDDAEARCPSKAKEIGEARAKVEAARAAGPATRVSLPDPSVPVAFAWSPDGTRAALLHGGELSIFDPDLRAETERYSVPRESMALRWLPAGNGVVVGDLARREFRVVDLAKKKPEAEIKLPGSEATDMRLSPDGKTLVVTWEMGISFVDLATQKVTELELSPLTISDLSISPSGNKLAVGLSDGTARVYSLPGLGRMPEIAYMATALRPYFQTEERLVLATDGGRVLTFDVTTGKQIGKTLVNDDCTPIIVGEKHDRVVWSCYAMLYAESTSGSKRISLYTPGTEAHLYTSFDATSVSANGAWIWYSLWGQQYIVDTKTGKLVAGVSVPSWTGVQFRPDGKRIAAIRTDGTSLWTSDLNKDERVAAGGDGLSLECSTMGVSSTGMPVFADVQAGEEGLPGSATPSLWGPAASSDATGPIQIDACPASLSGGARIGTRAGEQFDVVDLAKGTFVSVLPLSAGEDPALSANGAAVVVWGEAGIRVIDVATKKVTSAWKTRLGPKAEVFASPSGKRALVVQDQHGSLYEAGRDAALEISLGPGPFAFAGDDLLVEAREAEIVVHDLAAHEDRAVPGPKSVKRLAATPDGARVIAILPGETNVIDTTRATGGVVAKIGAISAPEQIVFFAAGRVLAVNSRNEGKVRFYQLPSGTRLGELWRFGAKAAVYRAETGNLETFGDVTSAVRCARDPQVLPFSDCSKGFVETGLLARTVAGRGCTAEDVGDVCD